MENNHVRFLALAKDSLAYGQGVFFFSCIDINMRFRQWLEDDQEDFMQHHKTGWIPDGAYEKYNQEGGLSWLGDKSKHPVLFQTKKYGPYTVEFRQSGEKVQYTKYDDDDEIVRDGKGLAVMMSPEEMKAKGLRETESSIVAFVGEDPIGLASNEFGTIGVWVEPQFQKLGIGSDLMVMFMQDNREFMKGQKIGQMTNAGINMSKAAYKKLAQKHGQDWFGRREEL